MKTTFLLLLLSFLLFALSTNPTLLGATEDVLDPVLDVAGEELQTGAGYYATPLIWAWGGGLTLAKNWNGSSCPFNVVQSPFEVNNGIPLIFSPILNKEGVVRVSTDLDIMFPGAPKLCSDLPIWKIGERSFVTLGGVGGSIIDRFRIVKHNMFPALPSYKLVFCRARMACQNIGIFNENGIRYLALSHEPYVVVFGKAQGSRIRKITDGHQIY